MVTRAELRDAIDRLGLGDAIVEIHVSLRSFPTVDGGPATLVGAFLDRGCTLVVPTMANGFFGIPSPPDRRPARNGTDYLADDERAARRPWPGMADVYDPSRTETDPDLGATPAYVAAHPDRIRARTGAGSLSALGPRAAEVMAAETDRDVYGPLRALVAAGGRVILMGVDLDRMTLLHLAEIEAGRRPFLRWSLGPDRTPVPCRGGECADGFPNLAAALAPVETTATVGESRWRVFDAAGAVARAADAIRSDPSITRCDAAVCIRCDDAIAGGPID